MVGRQNRDRLVDAVLLVLFKMFHPTFLDEFDHPSRVKIDTKADSTSVLAQVLDGQSKPPGARRSEHQPIGSFGEVLVGKSVAEKLIIDSEIVDHHAALGNPSRAASFENISGFSGKAFGNPSLDWSTAKPFIFEHREFLQVIKTLDFLERIKFELRFFSKPKRGTCRLMEVPLDGFNRVLVESLAGL